jgi:hypothetical protein
MWAVLFNLFKRNIPTKCIKELDFAWLGYSIEDSKRYNLMHNSGVIGPGKEFCKSIYVNKLPYNDDFTSIDRNKLTWKYVEQLIQLKDISKLCA